MPPQETKYSPSPQLKPDHFPKFFITINNMKLPDIVISGAVTLKTVLFKLLHNITAN
jgi:hypothetical protein